MSISFYANLGTWIAWMLLLRNFRPWQFERFFVYSMLVFATGIAFKLLRGDRGLAVQVSEVEWPSALILLHLVPFFNFLIYAIYFACGGGMDVKWTLMFIAPWIAGTGLVNRVLVYKKR